VGADAAKLRRKRRGVEVAVAVEHGEYRRDWWEACSRPFLRAQIRARSRTGSCKVDESDTEIDALRNGISQAHIRHNPGLGSLETSMLDTRKPHKSRQQSRRNSKVVQKHAVQENER
jgi:hypothetical protein